MPSFAAFSHELVKIAKAQAPAKVLPLAKADIHIFKELLKGSPVKVRMTEDAKMFGGGYFDQVNKEIGLSEKDFANFAHELGHAEVDKNVIGRMLQSRAARLANSLTSLGGIGAAILLAKGKKWGLLLPAALAAPTLLSEAIASVKGHGKLTDAGASDEQKSQYRKKMLGGFGSYLTAPATSTAIASLAKI